MDEDYNKPRASGVVQSVACGVGVFFWSFIAFAAVVIYQVIRNAMSS